MNLIAKRLFSKFDSDALYKSLTSKFMTKLNEVNYRKSKSELASDQIVKDVKNKISQELKTVNIESNQYAVLILQATLAVPPPKDKSLNLLYNEAEIHYNAMCKILKCSKNDKAGLLRYVVFTMVNQLCHNTIGSLNSYVI